MSFVIQAEGLTKSYGDHRVVDGVSLSIRRGECFGLLGPNGAGKTTTLRLLLGLIAPDGGKLTLLGHDVPDHAREARLRVGVVPQMDNLDPDFTVTENLMVYGRYFGMKDSEIEARLPELLEFANLTHKANAKVPTLSGGMKRRLTVARALVNDPDNQEVFPKLGVKNVVSLTDLVSRVIERRTEAEEIRKEFGVHDTLTLMRMLLVLLAADIHQLNEKMENFNRIEEKSLDSMIVALDTALGTQKP